MHIHFGQADPFNSTVSKFGLTTASSKKTMGLIRHYKGTVFLAGEITVGLEIADVTPIHRECLLNTFLRDLDASNWWKLQQVVAVFQD